VIEIGNSGCTTDLLCTLKAIDPVRFVRSTKNEGRLQSAIIVYCPPGKPETDAFISLRIAIAKAVHGSSSR
jgi:hypothetical protein